MEPRNRNPGPVLTRRGPVIERASEPGLPPALTCALVLVAILGGAYAIGLFPDGESIRRQVDSTITAFNRYWDPPKPPPAPPTRTATAPQPTIAPPASRPSPPPASTPRPEPSSPPAASVAPPPAPAPEPDSFREDFMRDVIGRLSRSAPATAPNSPPRDASPPPSVPSPPPAPPPAADSSSLAAAPSAAASPAPPGRSSVFLRPPGANPAVSPYSSDALDKFVEQELSTFNSSREVPAKRAAMQRIAAAAQLGHGPARGMIVRAFPVSTIVRDVVAPADVVRFSLDFVVHQRAFTTDPRRDFSALAGFLEGERRDNQLGQLVFDAIRDDPRLQTTQAINDAMALLYRAERGCAALRRHLNVHEGSSASIGHCGLDLAEAAKERSARQGRSGLEARQFDQALEALRNALGEPL